MKNNLRKYIFLSSIWIGFYLYGGIEIGNGFNFNDRLGGTEIGNARTVVNSEGLYEIHLFDHWKDVGLQEKMLDATAPLLEGLPRARIQIDIIPNVFNSVSSVDAQMIASGWQKVRIGKLDGHFKVSDSLGGILRSQHVDFQLYRGPEVILIHLVGRRGENIEKLLDLISTFKDLSTSDGSS